MEEKIHVYEKCQYIGCSNTVRTGSHLFRFPAYDDPRLKVWVNNTGNSRLNNWKPWSLRRAGVCKDHFRSQDLFRDVKGRLRIRKGTIPIHYEQNRLVVSDTDCEIKKEDIQCCLALRREEQVKTYPSMKDLRRTQQLENNYIKTTPDVEDTYTKRTSNVEQHQIWKMDVKPILNNDISKEEIIHRQRIQIRHMQRKIRRLQLIIKGFRASSHANK